MLTPKRWLHGPIACGLLWIAALPAEAAPVVIGAIRGDTFPNAVAVNARTNRVYMADFNDTVAVADGATNTVIAQIGVRIPRAFFTSNSDIAVNERTNRVFVVSGDTDTNRGVCTVLNGASNRVLGQIALNGFPNNVAVNAATNRVYVSSSATSSVSVIDGATNRVAATFSAGTRPTGIAVNERTNRVYVSSSGDASVRVFNGATNGPVAKIALVKTPGAIAVNANTNRIYVANESQLSVLDGASNRVLANVRAGFTQSGSINFPLVTGVDVNPTTNRVYFSVTASVNASSASLLRVLDGATNRIIGTVAVPFPRDVAVNRATGLIYVVSGEAGVQVIYDPPAPFSVSGQVTDGGGRPVAGISVAITSGPFGSLPISVLTDAAGKYFLPNLPAGIYTVRAVALDDEAAAFAPAMRVVRLETGSARNINFLALSGPFIAGRVENREGVGISGVRITARKSTGQTVVAQTNANGFFGFSDLAPGTYTLTPTASGIVFSPPTRTVSINATRATPDVIFIAMPAPQSTLKARSMLSAIEAVAGRSSVHLRFSTPLDRDFGGAWTVEINGRAVEIESVSYHQSTSSVVLGLPEDSLHSGDRVRVTWSNVRAASGHLLSGQSDEFSAR